MFNFFKNAIKKPIDIDIITSSKYYSENIEEFICQTKFPSWTKDIHMPSIKEIVNYIYECLKIRKSFFYIPKLPVLILIIDLKMLKNY